MGACLYLYRFLGFISTKLSPGNEEFLFLIFWTFFVFLRALFSGSCQCRLCESGENGQVGITELRAEAELLIIKLMWMHLSLCVEMCTWDMSGGPWRQQEGGWFPGPGVTSSSKLSNGSWESNHTLCRNSTDLITKWSHQPLVLKFKATFLLIARSGP